MLKRNKDTGIKATYTVKGKYNESNGRLELMFARLATVVD